MYLGFNGRWAFYQKPTRPSATSDACEASSQGHSKHTYLFLTCLSTIAPKDGSMIHDRQLIQYAGLQLVGSLGL